MWGPPMKKNRPIPQGPLETTMDPSDIDDTNVFSNPQLLHWDSRITETRQQDLQLVGPDLKAFCVEPHHGRQNEVCELGSMRLPMGSMELPNISVLISLLSAGLKERGLTQPC